MEQFRQVGEALGSLKALMIFRDDITVNARQCALLVDAFGLAFDSVADEIKSHLKFEEKLAKWKPLESPLRELLRVFREGEQYVRSCLEPGDWWRKAVALSVNADCVELHLHNLLWCVPVVLEAIAAASVVSGYDPYRRDWMDPTVFGWKFGKLYGVSPELRKRFDSAPREDRWILSETVAEKRNSGSDRVAELLLGPKGKLHPKSVLVGWPDYQVRRRLGSGGELKEIQWMGESFAMKHVIGDVERVKTEVEVLLSLAHPNVLSYMYAFSDDEKECFVVMELMSKDLSSYARRRVPLPLLVAVDVMLQIARGMKYLHARGIYHGELNPSNILVKPRCSSPEGYMLVKVANFGLSPAKNSKAVADPCIWYAPEVLSEDPAAKYTEKADVYSFAMVCFELLTGKIPFDENHLQGDKMVRNIKADVRPLFPFPSPKYLVGLTKRCWQAEPAQRPSFSSVCRILRYTKRFLILNPDQGQPESPCPPLDYFDIETSLSGRFSSWGNEERVSDIPFQMFAYRVVERKRTRVNVVKERSEDSGIKGASANAEENGVHVSALSGYTMSNSTESNSLASCEGRKDGSSLKKVDKKSPKQTGQPKARTMRTQLTPHTLKPNSDSRMHQDSPARQKSCRRTSDSELS